MKDIREMTEEEFKAYFEAYKNEMNEKLGVDEKTFKIIQPAFEELVEACKRYGFLD